LDGSGVVEGSRARDSVNNGREGGIDAKLVEDGVRVEYVL
jgi:hypothetical protein